jgi:hypothetical protein
MQKILDYRAPLCSLQGIKIHFCEFLYDFALKRNKLLVRPGKKAAAPEQSGAVFLCDWKAGVNRGVSLFAAAAL